MTSRIALSTLLLFAAIIVQCLSLDWWKPEAGLTWNWQLQGEIDTTIDVDVYDVDLFDAPEKKIKEIQDKGSKVICYISAGTWEDWRDDADKFPPEAIGNKVGGWPGERWLDITNKGVLRVMKARIKLAAVKGCDGVEPDNMQIFLEKKTGWDHITSNDQKKYNKKLAKKAHSLGLAIGLKNDIEQLKALHNKFDFAVNESCLQYDECKAYEDNFLASNKPVFHAEYSYSQKNYDKTAPDFCEDMNNVGMSTILKSYDLFEDLCSCADVDISVGCSKLLQHQKD